MITGRSRFNIYLLLLFVAFLACGCGSTKKDKDKPLSTLRIHIEVTAAPMDFSISIPVYREKPVMITVDKEPFLTELNAASAKVVDVMGGFALQIEFDHSGSMLLEQYTAANPGRHIAIYSLFGKKKEEGRWLAAPIIARRISNGVLIFTPDASRGESERIAIGLNNYHQKNQEKNKW
jgi:preprotein translocase subunit SecD